MKLKILIQIIIVFSILSCSKSKDNDYSNYLIAKINNVNRNFDCTAQLNYSYERGYNTTTIRTSNFEFNDGKTRNFTISICQAPKLGKYIFNNVGISCTEALGRYREMDSNSNITYNSIDGFINITSFTKNKITGTFEFKAKALDGAGSVLIPIIQEGKFEAWINAGNGDNWNGL